MDIKDYLHLYLGCECMIGDLNWKPETNLYGLAPGIDPNYGRPIKTKLDAHAINVYAHLTTLILRKLSDMTEDEAWEFVGGKSDHLYDDLKITKIDKTGIEIHYVINAGDEGLFPQAHKFDFYALGPYQFIWLLSKGFDLFGLIDAGLAIDKTKL